jgi:hypothetical protein
MPDFGEVHRNSQPNVARRVGIGGRDQFILEYFFTSCRHKEPNSISAMTKFINLLAVLALTFTSAFAQNFEGKVTYANVYKSKIPNVSDDQFNAMMGSTQDYFFKDGDYKSVINGTLLQWQLYINKDNKLYSKMSNSPAALWNDAAVNTDEVIKAELNKGVVEILGYKCDELILTCKSGVQKYYFSSKLKLDGKPFEKHKFGNWHEYLSRANAVPLKIIVDTQQFSVESTATAVTPMAVDAKIFELPAGIPLEKSPY